MKTYFKRDKYHVELKETCGYWDIFLYKGRDLIHSYESNDDTGMRYYESAKYWAEIWLRRAEEFDPEIQALIIKEEEQ